MPADQRHASHTNWDLIRDAVSGSESASTSLEVVVRRSWTSIYALIRASGRNPTDAADLTQGFVTDIFSRDDCLSLRKRSAVDFELCCSLR